MVLKKKRQNVMRYKKHATLFKYPSDFHNIQIKIRQKYTTLCQEKQVTLMSI